jgi:hypothetical protein
VRGLKWCYIYKIKIPPKTESLDRVRRAELFGTEILFIPSKTESLDRVRRAELFGIWDTV